MKTNIGDVDKIARLSLAILVGVLFYAEVISGTTALILGILAAALFITSFIGFCPLYTILGVNTCKRK